MNSVLIKLTGNKDRHKISNKFKFRSYQTRHLESAITKWCLQLFSLTFDWIFVKVASHKDSIKAWMSSNLGRSGIFILELFALARVLVAKSFKLYLYLELTVPQVSDCCPLGQLVQISYSRTKPTKWHVRTAKIQINLGINPDWSESSPSKDIAKDQRLPHANSEDSDQTGQTPRLIQVFAGRTGHFVGFVMLQLKYYFKQAWDTINLLCHCPWFNQTILKRAIKLG